MYKTTTLFHWFATRWLKALSALVLAAALAPAALAAPSEAETLAIGTWYGEYTEAGAPTQRFLTTRFPDGTFVLRARMYDKGSTTELVNRGLWGVSNGLYFTITTEINGQRTDPRNPQTTNNYIVQKQSPTEFEYKHLASDRSFRVVRVDPVNARLPD